MRLGLRHASSAVFAPWLFVQFSNTIICRPQISYKLANKNPSMALRFVSGLLASDDAGIGSGSGVGGALSTCVVIEQQTNQIHQ